MSNTTLSSKSIGIKLQSTHALTADQLKCVVTHLPRDADRLREMAPGMDEGDMEKVLAITRAHERNQERFAECVSHLRAYVRGGEYSMHLLNKLYGVIIAYFGMQDETWEVLIAAGVTLDITTGALYC
jgi:hypothetical protein